MSLFREIKRYLVQIGQDSSDFVLRPTDKIVTAVSGGPDSLTLLHLLAVRGLHPVENIIVAHLDHGLRPSSAAEAEQVRQMAVDWGVACHLKQVNVAALAEEDGLSIEEAGRKARYQFFAELAREVGADYIFTGHHAGDQAETVLMHFLRGSGLAGLRGMLAVSPLNQHPGLWVVRPLLNTSREAIEDYCQRHDLRPLMDESNKDTTFFRNRLRHELLPFLEGYNPQIRERLLAMASVAAADFDFLEAETAEAWNNIELEAGTGWLRFDLADWQRLPLSMRRSTLRLAVAQLRPNLRDVGFETIEQARQVAEKGEVGGEADLPGGICLTVGYDDLRLSLSEIELPLPDLPQLPSEEHVSRVMPREMQLENGWVLEGVWETVVDPTLVMENSDRWVAYLGVSEDESVFVRSRLDGERFQPLGMDGRSKSVKSLMIDNKIPAQLRPRWPIVATADHLLWIPGYAVDERARVRPESGRILKVSVKKI